jgi:hypothetical protein
MRGKDIKSTVDPSSLSRSNVSQHALYSLVVHKEHASSQEIPLNKKGENYFAITAFNPCAKVGTG